MYIHISYHMYILGTPYKSHHIHVYIYIFYLFIYLFIYIRPSKTLDPRRSFCSKPSTLERIHSSRIWHSLMMDKWFPCTSNFSWLRLMSTFLFHLPSFHWSLHHLPTGAVTIALPPHKQMWNSQTMTMNRTEMMDYFKENIDLSEKKVTALMKANNLGGAARVNSGCAEVWIGAWNIRGTRNLLVKVLPMWMKINFPYQPQIRNGYGLWAMSID